ncbi:MAG: hypothetical protein IT330_08430 [Anaerolineae bacterium]|nr:hypothetical protein [Anaerolineae bacterium]
MPWYIVATERKTWAKYLVEAEDEEAIYNTDDWEYLGYVDGDDTDHEINGPFRNKDEALHDNDSHVDG